MVGCRPFSDPPLSKFQFGMTDFQYYFNGELCNNLPTFIERPTNFQPFILSAELWMDSFQQHLLYWSNL